MTWSYRDLRFYELMLKELKKEPGFNPERFENLIIEQKRKMRKTAKEENDRKIVRDYGIDGFVEKFQLPDYIGTAEDADEYFREYEYLRCRPSAYDCTGDWFTAWYKIFRKPDGSFWAYHSVAFDF